MLTESGIFFGPDTCWTGCEAPGSGVGGYIGGWPDKGDMTGLGGETGFGLITEGWPGSAGTGDGGA